MGGAGRRPAEKESYLEIEFPCGLVFALFGNDIEGRWIGTVIIFRDRLLGRTDVLGSGRCRFLRPE